MKKVVIAIDSFKGCLSSAEAGKAAAKGIRSVFPECEIRSLPIADGGEGMLDVLIAATNGREVQISAAMVDAARNALNNALELRQIAETVW